MEPVRTGTAAAPDLRRITVYIAQRRLDLAVPADAPVAELLPALHRYAGADAPPPDTGLVLRTVTGRRLSPARSLAAQGVSDGDVLHLVPATLRWPEPVCDDVPTALAVAARGHSRRWSARTSRRAALGLAGVCAVAGAAVGTVYADVVGPVPPAVAALALAVTGVALVRTGDRVAGTVAAAAAPLYVAAAVLAAVGRTPAGWAAAAAGMLGCAAALLAAAGRSTDPASGRPRRRSDGRWLLVAQVVVGLLGAAAAAAATVWGGRAAAAGLALVLLAGAGALPVAAVRLAGLPLPPVGAAARDGAVGVAAPYAAVGRAGELLTGLLAGWSALVVAVVAVLAATGDPAGWTLAGLVTVGHALAARRPVAVHQRLAAGAGALMAAAVTVTAAVVGAPVVVAATVVGATAGGTVTAVVAAGRRPAATTAQAVGRALAYLETAVLVAAGLTAGWLLDLYRWPT